MVLIYGVLSIESYSIIFVYILGGPFSLVSGSLVPSQHPRCCFHCFHRCWHHRLSLYATFSLFYLIYLPSLFVMPLRPPIGY